MSSSSLLAGAVDTLVADSVKGRRVVVSPIAAVTSAALNAGNATCGTFDTIAGGAAGYALVVASAAVGDLVFLTPRDANAQVNGARALVTGAGVITITTGGNGVWNWLLVSAA
jgi:hypothetical protein